jgi:hypothetical protein
VDDDDRAWFDALVSRVLQTHFKASLRDIMPADGLLLYADFVLSPPKGDGSMRPYVAIPSRAALKKAMDGAATSAGST